VSGVGISQDGRMLSMVAVDGHEGKPYLGLTRPQFAWYFQTIGAWNAMAFDSGGSAQMAVRQPGQPFASIVNHPSDGKERQVADGLFVYGS
jgi:exopolysaccharide biosynthesis protein